MREFAPYGLIVRKKHLRREKNGYASCTKKKRIIEKRHVSLLHLIIFKRSDRRATKSQNGLIVDHLNITKIAKLGIVRNNRKDADNRKKLVYWFKNLIENILNTGSDIENEIIIRDLRKVIVKIKCRGAVIKKIAIFIEHFACAGMGRIRYDGRVAIQTRSKINTPGKGSYVIAKVEIIKRRRIGILGKLKLKRSGGGNIGILGEDAAIVAVDITRIDRSTKSLTLPRTRELRRRTIILRHIRAYDRISRKTVVVQIKLANTYIAIIRREVERKIVDIRPEIANAKIKIRRISMSSPCAGKLGV